MKPAKDLTPSEILTAMRADDLRAKVRNLLCDWSGLIDQASMQDIAPIELRRMELSAAEEIIAAVIHERTGIAMKSLQEKGIVPTMTGDEVIKLTRETS